MADFKVPVGDFFSLGGSNMIGTTPGYAENTGGIFSILSVIIKNLYVLVGIVLLIMIFVGGFGMILNAGNPEAAKNSNKTLTSAVMGFAILIAAYWIVKIIEIIFGLNILNIGGTP